VSFLQQTANENFGPAPGVAPSAEQAITSRSDREWRNKRKEETQMSSYHYSKIVDMSFDNAVISAKQALERHNFRVLTEINMKDNFKKGLNLDFRPYIILGACNPELTYRALQAEDKVGTMLPCNVVVQQKEDGTIEVSAVDPVASMRPIDHILVEEVAKEIRSQLHNVIDELSAKS
jgi:uncharacterized protein (DUF302 family)